MESTEITCTLEKRDYISFYYTGCRVMKRWARIVAAVIITLLCALVIYVLARPIPENTAPVTEAVLCLVLLGLCALYVGFQPRLYRAIAKRNVDGRYNSGLLMDSAGLYRLTRDGLSVEREDISLDLPWDKLSFYREDMETLILFYTGEDCALIIPKRYLNAEDEVFLREMLTGVRRELFM